MSDLGGIIKGDQERRARKMRRPHGNYHEANGTERIKSGTFDSDGDENNSDETKA